ncbi:MAG: phosphate acyltransferase [Verrucomicrobia bacterium]|nr:phosphate acyltransferase [Verrucomicrobiota bacterium]
MRFIASIVEKLQRHPKRIVFPEGTEPRVLQAARQFHSLHLGVPILLGDRAQVKDVAARLNISLEGLRVIHPRRATTSSPSSNASSCCAAPVASRRRRLARPCSSRTISGP